jgi:hypothetical protein
VIPRFPVKGPGLSNRPCSRGFPNARYRLFVSHVANGLKALTLVGAPGIVVAHKQVQAEIARGECLRSLVDGVESCLADPSSSFLGSTASVSSTAGVSSSPARSDTGRVGEPRRECTNVYRTSVC